MDNFNGATPFQTWKSQTVAICDNEVSPDFNGATPFQTWKSVTTRRARTEGWNFNGATPFQTWKSPPMRSSQKMTISTSMGPRLFRRGNFMIAADANPLITILQWGHAFSDVEIATGLRLRLPATPNFNGATPFQTWKWIRTRRRP